MKVVNVLLFSKQLLLASQLQAEEHQQVLHHLVDQQRSMLDQLVTTQIQTCQQLYDRLTHVVRLGGPGAIGGESEGRPSIQILKMMVDADHKAFLNAFDCSARELGSAESQLASISIPYLVGPAQQVVDTIPIQDTRYYSKLKEAILQTLNLSEEVYCLSD